MVWRVHFKKWNQLQLKCLPNVTIEKEAAAAQTKKKNIETKHSIKSRKFTCLLCAYFLLLLEHFSIQKMANDNNRIVPLKFRLFV